MTMSESGNKPMSGSRDYLSYTASESHYASDTIKVSDLVDGMPNERHGISV